MVQARPLCARKTQGLTVCPAAASFRHGASMTGYENSPDYGGGDIPPWAMWIAALVVVGLVVGCAWLGS